MAPIIPDIPPNRFVAGTTVKYTRSLNDFQPSDGWSYVLYLNGLTQKFNKAASVVDNIFQIVLIPSDTASLNPGPYRFTERVTNTDGSVYDLNGDALVMNIEANVASAAAGVYNTWEERTLAVVEAAIAGQLTQAIQSYQISGRTVNKIPIAELRQIRGELKAAVWRQNNPGALGIPYRVQFAPEPESPVYPPTWQDVTGLGS